MHFRFAIFLLVGSSLLAEDEGTTLPITTTGENFFASTHWTQAGGGYAGCEGSQWITEEGEPILLFAAQHDQLALRWSRSSGLQTWRDDSPAATSFRPDGNGGYYVVEQATRQVTRWNEGAEVSEVLADRYEGKRLNRPNDLIVKSDGSLWFTDPDFGFQADSEDQKELDHQHVFRLDPATGNLESVLADLEKPNGIAFSPDESSLFLTDARSPEILHFTLGEKGELQGRKIFATLPEGGLDGISFDPAGRLWVTSKNGVTVFAPDATILSRFPVPSKATSIAFHPSGLVCVTGREAVYIAELAPIEFP